MELSEIVKKLWDEDSMNKIPLKVIISGSSRLLIQKGLTESLAGRFEVTYMGHWTMPEMQKAFGWSPEQYVWFGGYPGSAVLVEDERRWKRYITDSLVETSISILHQGETIPMTGSRYRDGTVRPRYR
ncbi:MAG: hypothetical protein U5L72_17250 [Bacteroidales bacterium]|nr:hypothetical protein [Bacteroidales bacterium]